MTCLCGGTIVTTDTPRDGERASCSRCHACISIPWLLHVIDESNERIKRWVQNQEAELLPLRQANERLTAELTGLWHRHGRRHVMGNPATGCKCGSGGHPRHCPIHPFEYNLHVANINFTNVLDDESPEETPGERLAELRRLYDAYEKANLAALRHRCEEEDKLIAERDAALAVVGAVYQESKVIHAAYKALPEELRLRVERSSPIRCEKHGGIGFSSDCIDCQVSGTETRR